MWYDMKVGSSVVKKVFISNPADLVANTPPGAVAVVATLQAVPTPTVQPVATTTPAKASNKL